MTDDEISLFAQDSLRYISSRDLSPRLFYSRSTWSLHFEYVVRYQNRGSQKESSCLRSSNFSFPNLPLLSDISIYPVLQTEIVAALPMSYLLLRFQIRFLIGSSSRMNHEFSHFLGSPLLSLQAKLFSCFICFIERASPLLSLLPPCKVAGVIWWCFIIK